MSIAINLTKNVLLDVVVAESCSQLILCEILWVKYTLLFFNIKL